MTVEYGNGARREYGPIDSEVNASSHVVTYGVTRQLVAPIDFADPPSTSEIDAVIQTIPANSFCVSARFYIAETVSGGTTFYIGLSETDGTAIDADGFIAAETGTAVGTWVDGAGALVGATIGADAGQVTVAGDRTAGAGVLVIEYLPPQV